MGQGSCFDRYGRMNKYMPLKISRNNGSSGEYVMAAGGGFGLISAIAMKLASTVSVKTNEIHRCDERTTLLTFKCDLLGPGPQADNGWNRATGLRLPLVRLLEAQRAGDQQVHQPAHQL